MMSARTCYLQRGSRNNAAGPTKQQPKVRRSLVGSQSLPIQPHLIISGPNDRYEREAGRVAGAILDMPEPLQEQETHQAKSPTRPILSVRSGGQPLPQNVRSFFEPRFGHDFSQVRVHTDAKAAESARAVNALGYTVGSDIVFDAGQFAPGTLQGQRLLAHELAHVVQRVQFVRPYRRKNAFNFGKLDDPSLKEDSFSVRRDKKTKPWIRRITIEFKSKKTDADSNHYWIGTAHAQYYSNPAKLSDFSFPVSGGSRELGRTDKGNFTVHRIEGVGYNSGSFSGTVGVDYSLSEREGPRKRYSKDLRGNMSFAVFYNRGEALHAGPLDYSSHGCVHVDWTDLTNIKKLNYHSVIGLTKVRVKYTP